MIFRKDGQLPEEDRSEADDRDESKREIAALEKMLDRVLYNISDP